MELRTVNNTSFNYEVNAFFKDIDKDMEDVLHNYQLLTHNYFIKNDFLRGILIYYEMGMGKTRQSMSIAEYYSKLGKRVFILASKSLHNVFELDLIKLLKDMKDTRTEEELKEYIKKTYKFITLNSSNMPVQFNKALKLKSMSEDVVLAEVDDLIYDNRIGDLSSQDLENSVIIIDEAHNLFNAITNGSKNATILYQAIMDTKNIKLIFLTGTPIINDPFELVPCFNMIHGSQLLPIYYEDFQNYFIDRVTNSILNKDKFMDRLTGYVVYYGSFKIKKNLLSDMIILLANETKVSNPKFTEIISTMENFPSKRKTIIKRVAMSMDQYKAYAGARKLERLEEAESRKRGFTENTILNKHTFKGQSSYRVKSRLASNFLLPENKKFDQKFVDRLNEHSPKFAEILYDMTEGVLNAKKSIHIIYSNFVANNGLEAFERVLMSRGIKEVDINSPTSTKYDQYAKITGNVQPEDRAKILEIINTKENYDGSVIRYLLLSPTGVEGVNIFTARHFYYMEPHWNFKTFEQAEARIYRYKALSHLPKSERWVQSHIYLSAYPQSLDKEIRLAEPTTDEELFFRSIKNKNLTNHFLQALIEVSVNCQTSIPEDIEGSQSDEYFNINCRVCTPSNKKLYENDIIKDMKLPSPCTKIQEQEVDVDEVEYNGKKYYYPKGSTVNNFNVFYQHPKLGTYLTLEKTTKEYQDLLKFIFKL